MSQGPALNTDPANKASGAAESAVGSSQQATSCTTKLDGPFFHEWTGGDAQRSHIVDNKYFDVTTGEVMAYGRDQWVSIGPPTLDIYWQNRRFDTSVENAFEAVVKHSALTMTEYVIRVGAFLKDCKCSLHLLTATTYSVNVVVFVDMSYEDMHVLWRKHGI